MKKMSDYSGVKLKAAAAEGNYHYIVSYLYFSVGFWRAKYKSSCQLEDFEDIYQDAVIKVLINYKKENTIRAKEK